MPACQVSSGLGLGCLKSEASRKRKVMTHDPAGTYSKYAQSDQEDEEFGLYYTYNTPHGF